MTYFTFLPIINYFGTAAPNILTRSILAGSGLDQASVYHPYTIQDGDRPDLIAYYYYGDANLDWLILLANNIFDIVSQWPLTADEFETYLTNKYGSVNITYTTYDHFELYSNIPNIDQNEYSNLSPEAQKYWGWNNYLQSFIFIAYNFSLTASFVAYSQMNASEQIYWQPITQYDTENTANELKRNIKIIDRQYAQQLKSDLQSIMQGS